MHLCCKPVSKVFTAKKLSKVWKTKKSERNWRAVSHRTIIYWSEHVEQCRNSNKRVLLADGIYLTPLLDYRCRPLILHQFYYLRFEKGRSRTICLSFVIKMHLSSHSMIIRLGNQPTKRGDLWYVYSEYSSFANNVYVFLVLSMCLQIIGSHGTDISVGVWLLSRETFLVKGGAWTHVLADGSVLVISGPVNGVVYLTIVAAFCSNSNFLTI